MTRREFLAAAAATSVGSALSAASAEHLPKLPIIDTHIHLFDTNRPQGVPWPEKSDKILYKPALPARYRDIAVPLGVTGAIVVEASPWSEDNQWVLDLAAKDNIIVGVVGNLEPGKPEFGRQLDRLAKNPLFRGIRNGNLWGHDISSQTQNPALISDLKLMAQAGMVLDTANPNPALIEAILRITDQVPDLKLVIDHLPQMAIPEDKKIRSACEANMREIGQRHQVYVKVSEVLRKVDGQIPTRLEFYRHRLDELYDIIGEDRLLYGSDWPNSDQWLPFHEGLTLVRQYFMEKGPAVAEKYFWKNSIAAYQWQKRDQNQPWFK
ncbi:Predicted metal-dependent hydrolase, TIM-barrel fold [Dyadobacter soli]|uniref:Predicted metal-dependent hydrolase, TIM-barrel fold n=1 Tax=Dyadobacter soli TaxID=659014 RepID=A0A1G7MM57_9BACT|nr:amidohydrolase family protein [Dyadobacter soli]SDF62791.1 Predicted metal-dependent hydrolase, TIM-barrel fold [Dyadobacter soli]